LNYHTGIENAWTELSSAAIFEFDYAKNITVPGWKLPKD
jgi:hypothetical protein